MIMSGIIKRQADTHRFLSDVMQSALKVVIQVLLLSLSLHMELKLDLSFVHCTSNEARINFSLVLVTSIAIQFRNQFGP